MIVATGIGGASVVPVGGWVALNAAFPAASNTNKRIRVNDYGYPITFVSNGNEYVPEGGQATLALSGIGYGIMPSGTVSAGASGHFVSGTALPNTYSEGLWMYFAANVIVTPNISAGFKWCVFSNATTCTIYSSGPGSAAIDFTVGGAVTGYFGAEVTSRSVTIPAGLMGENGQLETTILNSHPNSAAAKTTRVKLGSAICSSGTPTTSLTTFGKAVTTNTTSGVQLSSGTFLVSSGSTANVRTTIDTTAATTYSLTLQMAVATEYIINHSFRLDLFKA